MALVDRVKSILLNPKQEWPIIDAEPTTPAELYKGYIIPLAAIGPIAQAIGSSVFGYRLPFIGTYKVPLGSAITSAVVSYLLTLASVYVLALIIDALAPNFNGTRNQVQALKVAAYSATASWVAGIFNLLPGVRWLSILGLYSFYLLWLGLPILMKTPPEKTPAYIALIILAGIVLFLVVGLVAGMFVSSPLH